jgi:hypothetical protein
MARLTIKQEWRNYREMKAIRQFDRTLHGSSECPAYWLAKIDGFDRMHVFKRTFIDSVVDYSQANSKQSRGVFLYWHLDDGVYQACLGRNYETEFFQVSEGEKTTLGKDEVCEWINARLASMY